MSNFSLQTLSTSAAQTFRRFPLPIFFAVAATVSMNYFIHHEPTGNALHPALRLSMVLYFSMLWTISVSLFTERFVVKPWAKWCLWSTSIVFAGLYYLTLPAFQNGVTGIRFALLAVALHLLVAFAPFLSLRDMNGLWQFNKTLFIRILLSGVYSGVLYGGLALAILAVDKLFEVRINEKFYMDLWLTIAGIFNTWFFLSGVPANISSLERATDYPKGLKIFTLYVLIPLIAVYLVILYTYAGKIVVTSDWPVGWVANLVIAFSIFGILSFLLIYPLRNDASNAWVKFYSRLFYFLLAPLIVLLYVSIFKRIDMYGFTVERYLVVLLAVWLSFVAVFFILTSGKQIWVIPLSLCAFVMAATFGPWGSFAVSYRSQIHELTTLLDRNQVTVNGKVDTTRVHDVKADDYGRIESIVRYINGMHGPKQLQYLFDQNVDSVIAKKDVKDAGVRSADLAVLDMLHMKRVETDSDLPYSSSYGIIDKVMMNSEGYDFVARFTRADYHENSDSTINFIVEADTVHLSCSATKGSFELTFRDYEPLVLDLTALYASLPGHENLELTPQRMTIIAENPMWKAKLVFSFMEIHHEKGKTKLVMAAGVLMLKFTGATVPAATQVSR
jgi:hypothetical protein